MQIGFGIGYRGYGVSGDKSKLPVSDEFATKSLDQRGISQSQETINAFKDGFEQGRNQARRKTKAP